MTDQQKYEELKFLAEQMGLGVRSEIGDFDGGICTVKEQRIILLNRRHPLARRINIMARALHKAGLDSVFVKPAVRALIDDEVAMFAANDQ
jgi:hypothetical protein